MKSPVLADHIWMYDVMIVIYVCVPSLVMIDLTFLVWCMYGCCDDVDHIYICMYNRDTDIWCCGDVGKRAQWTQMNYCGENWRVPAGGLLKSSVRMDSVEEKSNWCRGEKQALRQTEKELNRSLKWIYKLDAGCTDDVWWLGLTAWSRRSFLSWVGPNRMKTQWLRTFLRFDAASGG